MDSIPGIFTDKLEEGQDALRNTDWETAKNCFETALKTRETPEALELLALAAWWLDDEETTFQCREKAFNLYRQQNNPRGAARVAISLSYDYFSFRGEPAIAGGWSRRAHRLLNNLDLVPEHGLLAAWDGNIAIEVDHNPEKALKLGKEAVEIAKKLQDFDLGMMGFALQGLSLVFEGKLDEGMPLLDEATTAAMTGEISDLETSINVCCYLIAACEWARDYSRAVQWCFHVKNRTGEGTFPLMFSFCQIHYAGVLMWNGNWDEAEILLKKATNNLIESRPAHAAEGLVKLARLYRFRGEYEKTVDLLNRAEKKPFRMLGANIVLLEKSALAFDKGEYEIAAELAERYLRNTPDKCRLMLPDGLEILALSLLSLNRFNEAEAASLKLREIAEMAGTEPMAAATHYVEGMIYLERNNNEQARKDFERSADLYSKNKNPWNTARSRSGLAQALHRLGKTTPALQEAETALRLYKALKAGPKQEQIKSILKQIKNLPAHHADQLSPDAFTDREIQILKELSDGKSNSRIASDLYISIRTVERHISNIYGKLGISGKAARSKATAFAHRNGLAKKE
jgi:LuxR family transcriptional regulator, maltose regulon positive regulatory protein